MGLTKKILFDNLPEHDHIRDEMRAAASARTDAFPVKIPARRKNQMGTGARWDPAWASHVTKAAKELDIEFIHVNDQICFRSAPEADRVRARAEVIWKEFVETYRYRR